MYERRVSGRIKLVIGASMLFLVTAGAVFVFRIVTQSEKIVDQTVYAEKSEVPDVKVKTVEEKLTDDRVSDSAGIVNKKLVVIGDEASKALEACLQFYAQTTNYESALAAAQNGTSDSVQRYALIAAEGKALSDKQAISAAEAAKAVADKRPIAKDTKVNSAFCDGKAGEILKVMGGVLAQNKELPRFGIVLRQGETIVPDFSALVTELTTFGSEHYVNFVQQLKSANTEEARRKEKELQDVGRPQKP